MSRVILALTLLLGAGNALASGPRWVTGPPYFTGPQGVAIGWKQRQLLYSTDPGNLSANVSHAAADALVAAAAGVWNVPVANLTVGQGGELAEHVSGNNIYLDSAGLHLPADVMSTNAAAIPLAIVYDTDGSVTDTLLGAGASDPSSCRQNAVTESVDSFDPAGYILHALIVVNGRCTGTPAAAQSQLRYQLMRAFGRVLGLAWSQTNDNVFTGTPRPTSVQAQNWPILHPIDIVCGTYTYQCLPNPFQLRTDDIAALVSVYPLTTGALLPGKAASPLAQAIDGYIAFPTGQGMTGVNVLVQREAAFTTVPDAFYVGSAVSGASFRQAAASPFVAAPGGPAGSFGTTDPGHEGYYAIAYFPMLGLPWENLIVSTEPINPLYTGDYSLGPYSAGAVAPSGAAELYTARVISPGWSQINYTPADAPTQCGNGGDGTLASPMQIAATGWWPGLLCGYGHVSYVSTNVKPGRSFTLEVTALDAAGLATTAKAMPVLAWFGASDTAPAQPSLALAATAFNAVTVGTTALAGATGQATNVRFGIADQRGDGRPDFNFQARFFYADSVAPAQVPAAGGTITVTGTGFRAGNAVTVNGVAATVASWTANTIVLTAPSVAAAGATGGTGVDVRIVDRTTGATTTMTAALTYLSSTNLPNAMRLVSAPAGTVVAGSVAAAPLTVQLIAADGVTPVANETVQFSALGGATVLFGPCNATVCAVRTDARGMASATVTPGSAGTFTMQAQDGALNQQATFNVLAQAGKLVLVGVPESPVRDGTVASNWLSVQVFAADGVTRMGNRPLTFSVLQGQASFGVCAASPCTVITPPWAEVDTPVTPLSVGTIVLQIADGDVKTTVTLLGTSNADTLQIVSPLPATMYVGGGALLGVRLLQADGVTGDSGRVVTLTAPAGVTFAYSGTNICSLTTDGGGYASNSVYPTQAGIINVQAAYGSVLASQTVDVQPAPATTLKLLSAPADGSLTGRVAALPFAVKLQAAGNILASNMFVVLEGTRGSVVLSACGYSSCQVWVDGNGVASTMVTPLVAGQISLSATYNAASQNVQFIAAGQAETMTIATQPDAAGAPLGAFETLAVKVIGPDGVTPPTWDLVTFSVLSGPFTLLGASSTQVTNPTDGTGIASAIGIATGSGPVQVRATDGVASQVFSFMAGTPANVLRLVSAPTGNVQRGGVAATPFAVQLFAADGVTPAAGKVVTFTVTSGSALFGACASGICNVATDVHGIAQTTVQPTSAGLVGLLAAYGPASQPASFVSIVPPDVLRLLGQPVAGGYVGTVAAQPFALHVFLPDGITPAAQRSVTLSVTNGAAALAACAGSSSCILQTDASGVISTAVTPLSAGTIGLLATDGAASLSASFNALARPDVLQITSTPAANSYVGLAAASSFTVRVFAGDGVTVAPGRSVTLSVTNGSAAFAACGGGPTCTLVSDANGALSTSVTPLAAGTITLTANEGGVTASASFVAIDRPDTMLLVTAPAGAVGDGLVAAQAFAVQVLAGDGVTPRAGKSIVFSTSSGSVVFGACALASCTLVTDAKGIASTTITPTSVGTISIQAVEGSLIQSATFQGILLPDLLRVVSGPGSGAFTGVAAAAPFALQVQLADGKTPAAQRNVTISVTNGAASFGACAAAGPCVLQTDATGAVTMSVTPRSAGTITLTAADGSAVQTYTFTAVDRPDTMSVLVAPTGSLPVGVAAGAFTVRLLQGDGVTPDAGKPVVFSIANGSVSWSACPTPACTVTTAADGTATAFATPTAAGPVTLTATYGALVQTATISAYLRPDVLKLTSGPADGSYTGVVATKPFSIVLLQGDGVTPDGGKNVTISVTDGSAGLSACAGASTCTAQTDALGAVSSFIVPRVAGSIGLSATAGSLVQSAHFQAVDRPDTLSLVAAPSGSLPVGVAAGAFTVRLLQGDGVTPDAGKPVVFSVAPGSASWSACGAATCTVTTAADGTATAFATPAAAGFVTLTATYGALIQTATISAYTRQDAMKLMSAPADGSFTGVMAQAPFRVLLLQGDGIMPDPGKTVTLSVTGGSASLGLCAGAPSCTATTDADGLVTTVVTPLKSGSITLSAAVDGVAQTASFTAVDRPDTLRLITVPTGTVHVGAAATFAVQLLQGDGVSPDPGKPVLFTATGATLGGCLATPCTLLSGADGKVAVSVTPTAEGTVALVASYAQASVSVSFWASKNDFVVTSLTPPIYLAEGAVITTTLSLQASENGQPASGQGTHWTSLPGLTSLQSDTLTDGTGSTSAPVTAGPLAGGTTATATACVWTSVCADFTASGVSATLYTPAIQSGGLQSVLSGQGLQPVILQITDGAGHTVAAAPVTVYQTVTALDAPCPATGRCPTAPVLLSRVVAATAGNDGRLTVDPLTVDGVATQTEIAVATGTQGFISTILTRQP